MMDSQSLKTISFERKKKVEKYFSQMMKMRDSPILITWWESLKSLFVKVPDIETKIKQKNKGVTTIFSHLDINFVLKKFLEIDKLKNLLLNKDQLLLFEYLPKPIILKNLRIDLNYAGLSNIIQGKKKMSKDISLIENDLIMKTKIVQQAFNNICSKSEMTQIDLKLIDMLDENMKDILKSEKGLDSPSSNRNFNKEKNFQRWETLNTDEKIVVNQVI